MVDQQTNIRNGKWNLLSGEDNCAHLPVNRVTEPSYAGCDADVSLISLFHHDLPVQKTLRFHIYRIFQIRDWIRQFGDCVIITDSNLWIWCLQVWIQGFNPRSLISTFCWLHQNREKMSILKKFPESMCKCKIKDLTNFLTHACICRAV